MLFSELKNKEVINIKNCKKLGHVCDLDFDECNGCILKIMVPSCFQFFHLCQEEQHISIPYKNIKQIGPDIILVDI